MSLVVVTGPPGSGKTTQTEKLVEFFKPKIQQFICGEFISYLIHKKGNKELQKYTKIGKMKSIPPTKLVPLIKKRFKEILEFGKAEVIVHQKVPWTIEMSKELQKNNVHVDLMIVFCLPKNKILERVKWRRVDPKTKVTYNAKYNIPKDEKIKARLQSKFGDSPDLFERIRLKRYEREEKKIIEYYKDKCKFGVIELNCEGDIDTVFKRIKVVFEELMSGKMKKV